MIRKIISCVLVFVITAALLAGLLTSAALIPTDAIKDNFISSAEFYVELDKFLILNNIPDGFLVDRYADITLLEIAYHLDSAHPFTSAIQAMHNYGAELQPGMLIDIAENDIAPDVSYSRYWHGTVIFLRLFMLFMDIRGVYILNFIVFLALTVALCRMLIKRKCLPAAIFLIIGMILTRVYMMPLCIEYVSTCLLMLIVSIAVLKVDNTEREKYIPYVFIVSGTATCFFDFLTTETLTLALPLVLLFCVRAFNGRKEDLKKTVLFCVECIALWLIPYALMFLTKWALSAIVSGAEEFGNIIDRASYRVDGGSSDAPYGKRIAAIVLNLSQIILYSFTDTYTGIFGLTALYIFIIAGAVYMLRREKCDFTMPILILIIGLIPFGRYFILPSHSQVHAYFTYRAQFVSIVALLSSMTLCFDLKALRKSDPKNERNKNHGKRKN